MTMWTSAEAINAEVEYRRERVRLTRRAVRKRRAKRKAQAQAVGHSPQRVTSPTAERADHRHRGVTVPAQRTNGSGTTTKQPV